MEGGKTNSTCKTSVVIPVYNTREYLPACLDSVLAQTQEDFEVILVDDGSTDGSIEIELAYAARDPRIRVIQQPNLRQGAARNRGLAEARGEYVYFMDSDDFIVPELFESCYQACKDFQLDFVMFDSAGFVDDPNVERPDLFAEMRDRRGKVTEDVCDGLTYWKTYLPQHLLFFVCWLEYFDRSFLLDNDLRFVEGIYFEDNDWILRIFLAAERIKYLPLKLHRYRDRPGSNVHSGFTAVLADSCFDVHAILCSLARAEQDPVRLKMVQNVCDAKDFRFTQFAELEPTDYLRQMSACFVQFLLEECARDDLPEAVRSMHFAAVIHLAEGVASWPNPPVVLTKEMARALMHLELPAVDPPVRIGIYGTGLACEGFLKVFDARGTVCFFLETDAAPHRQFHGKRVVGIEDARDLDLDMVVITSSKHSKEMKANVRCYLGEEMPTYTAPHRIFLLADGPLADLVEHPRLYCASRSAKRAARGFLDKRPRLQALVRHCLDVIRVSEGKEK